jgi:hypothetical protein
MTRTGRIIRSCGILFLGFSFAFACAFDDTLREYLDVHFWLPFSKQAWHFEKNNIKRISAPYAGMTKAAGNAPLAKLRAAYQKISQPVSDSLDTGSFDTAGLQEALTAARAEYSMTVRDREEVDLIDAKIDMRSGQPDSPEPLRSAQKKLEVYLRTARTPEFLSEARGWLARIHFLLGEQTEAGKIYLDDLNRSGSNLSRETLLNSLEMTYGYNGGPELLAHLEEYFDTPEHAAFAIQLVTNPHWDRSAERFPTEHADDTPQTYARIKGLLERHADLLQSENGSNALALLGMRTALRMGDPPSALKIAAMVPGAAEIRAQPDFDWMLASAHFLSREYAAAEQPLLSLFQSSRASNNQKAAAAYALCGVYQKNNKPTEQIRFALWLHTAAKKSEAYVTVPAGIRDQSVYWAVSGWDLGLLLDAQAPIDALESFLNSYPDMPDIRLVRYSLAVRLARENRFEESAKIYQSIQANRRAPRMRQLGALYQQASRKDLAPLQMQEARYELAEFLSANPEKIFFNDALWSGFQRYALSASTDSRLTGEERQNLMAGERKLKDGQEERWRAYLILRDIVRDAGQTDLGRRSAQLAIRCLRGISDRFERQSEIRKATVELSAVLRQ